jgi:dihydrofolate reductase
MAIDEAHNSAAEKIFIIGGAQIYHHSLTECLVDEMFLTHVDASFNDADVFFPEIEKSHWETEEIGHFTKDENNEYSGTFIHYRKKQIDF